jgi:WD40 repeat protein
MTQGEKPRLFISYAHSDGKELARRLTGDLRQRGYEVWLDEIRLQAGSCWSSEIEQHIDGCEAVLALLSRGSAASEICRGEHLRALRQGKRVIPLLVEGADRPIYLEARQYLAFDDDAVYGRNLEDLLLAIERGETALLNQVHRSTYVTAPPLPRHFVPRPHEVERLRQVVIADTSERRIALTAVRAMGGIGKTVLAQALCHDQAIKDAYPDGVIWATIGQKPTDLHLIAQMREIAKSLGDDLAYYDTLQACANQFRTQLEKKAALIVLDDVWSARDVQPFIADAARSRLLLTTRQRDVVKATGAREFCLDVLRREQALQLLAEWSEVEELPPEAEDITIECGYLPLGISMIGALVRGESAEAWKRVLRRLRQADLGKIRMQFPDYPYPSLLAAIQVSVDSLEPGYRTKYLDLAVFQPDVPLPEAVFQTLWHTDADSVADVVDAWVAASLANRGDAGVTLHDLQMDYVHKLATDQQGLHRRLVESYRCLCKDGWASGPDDGYYFAWLAYHLAELGEVEKLLLDPKWMRAKLARGDVASLLADYDWATDNSDVRLVGDALRLSAHVLDKHPELLTSQLTGRLLSATSPAIRKMMDESRREEKEPWIELIHHTMMLPGGTLMRTLEGHTAGVTAVAVTPDRQRAVSGSSDRTLKVWDLRSGGVIRTLEGHTAGVWAIALALDGQRAVSGSSDQTVKVWDLERGVAIRTFKGHTGGVNAVAVTPDGRRAVSAAFDQTLRVWDLERGRVIRTLKGSADVEAVAITADGRRVISCGRNLKVWDVGRRRVIHTLEGHSRLMSAVAATPDGRRAVSGSSDWLLQVWDLERGQLIRTLRTFGKLRAVAMTPDGRLAVASSSDWLFSLGPMLQVCDLERGERIRNLVGHSGEIRAVAVTPDGQRAVSGSDDRTVKVWDLERHQLVRAGERHWLGLWAVTVTPDGKYAISGSEDRTLKVWDLKRGTVIRTLEGHRGLIMTVAVTPDGQRAVSGSDDGTVKVWDLQRAEVIRSMRAHEGRVWAVAVTPDGRRVVSGLGDGTLKLWDLRRGALIRTLEGHSGEIAAVVVTPDGRRAVAGCFDGALKVWDLRRGVLIRSLKGHTAVVTSVALAPGGQQVISGSYDGTLKIWDLTNGEVSRTLSGLGEINTIAVTPDGQRAVLGSTDGMMKVLELHSGTVIATFVGEAGIRCCAVLPDGKTFLAGERSGSLHFLRLVMPKGD